jgi:hypothetical protein
MTTIIQKGRPQVPAPTRPVTEVLLELAYAMHATKPVAAKPASDWRPRKSR